MVIIMKNTVKKNLCTFIAVIVAASATIVFAGCSDNGAPQASTGSEGVASQTSDDASAVSQTKQPAKKRETIKIDDIAWNVDQGIVDGEKYVLLDYTNNSKYTVTDFEMTFKEKGSVTEEDKENFYNEIKDKFNKATGFATEVGYMKVAEPSIAGAVENLKEEVPELEKIIAIPVFLAPGIHTNIDIPTLLGLSPLETDPRCPDGNYPDDHYLSIAEDVDFDGDIELLPAIGPDDNLLEVIDKRINESLSDSKLNGDAKTGILLVSHGSRLKYNKEFISEVYRKFSETTDYPSNFGFMELVEPNIPTSINKLINENEIDRLVVVPVFIAPGVHTTSDIPTILGLKEADSHSHSHSHSHEHGHEHHHHHHHDLEAIDFEGEILYPEPIGSDDILIDILVKNMEKAL